MPINFNLPFLMNLSRASTRPEIISTVEHAKFEFSDAMLQIQHTPIDGENGFDNNKGADNKNENFRSRNISRRGLSEMSAVGQKKAAR